MTTTDSPALALEPLDLAAMLCSRVCHDVISPVGAIVNGLEVLEDESDPSMRDVALDLIKRSAGGASAKLQFCRLAFGAAGSVGASIDTGDAEIGRARPAGDREDRARLEGAAPVPAQEQGQAAAQPLPDRRPRPSRAAASSRSRRRARARRRACASPPRATNARLQAGFADLLCGRSGAAKVDAHSIQPYFAGLVARECGMALTVEQGPEASSFRAAPVETAAAPRRPSTAANLTAV